MTTLTTVHLIINLKDIYFHLTLTNNGPILMGPLDLRRVERFYATIHRNWGWCSSDKEWQGDESESGQIVLKKVKVKVERERFYATIHRKWGWCSSPVLFPTTTSFSLSSHLIWSPLAIFSFLWLKMKKSYIEKLSSGESYLDIQKSESSSI